MIARRIVVVVTMVALLVLAQSARAEIAVIRVGAKNFTEQLLLGEMIAQTIEHTTTLAVERRFQLGGTHVTFEALRAGAIDVYPEYTGTGLLTILKEPAPPDRIEARRVVDERFRARFAVAWLPGFGFENTYALAVRADDARFTDVRTVGDLARSHRALALGGTHEFMDRPDGFDALVKAYALDVRDGGAVSMDAGLLYEAIASNAVDVIAAFSTDARVNAFRLRVLDDDRHFFPPYDAAPIARVEALDTHPSLGPALRRLAGIATNDDMRALAYEVDVRGRPAAAVVTAFLATKGIVDAARDGEAASSTGPIGAYFWDQRAYVARLVVRHLELTLVALVVAIVAGTLLGFAVARSDRLAAVVFPIVGTVQTVPSLALLGFLVPILGIGVRPALVALFLYALLPIVRSTNAGIRSVDPRLVDVGRGIGLTNAQILRRIEIALALPTILAGIRTSAVILVGSATLASLVGAGGLGDPIFRGLSSLKTATILLGAIPAALLALVLDKILGMIEKRVVSPGLRTKR